MLYLSCDTHPSFLQRIIEHLCSFLTPKFLHTNKWNITFSSFKVKDAFVNTRKKICIAAHTTPFFDTIILNTLLQKLGEIPMVYMKSISLLFPYIPEYGIEIHQGGFVNYEIDRLSKMSEFCHIIFPSGRTIRWKTGFYYLAKNLHKLDNSTKIVVLGIDYTKQTIVVDSVIDPIESFEETKQFCITRLRQYSAGPFSYLLRIICNYGCETYDYGSLILVTRIIIFIGIFIH